ncbi:MAG TPA: oligosaccharide flippase family protein, partial [Acholeplasmataceae bacterium]|nr:oligosaccharide flippase family protein [Acholeplasmataceae bacterium]
IIGVVCALAINVLVVVKVKHEANPDGEKIESKEFLVFGLPFALSTTMFWVVPMLEKIVIRDLTDWNVLAIYTSAAIFVTAMSLIKVTTNSICIPYVYKNYADETRFKKIFHTSKHLVQIFLQFIIYMLKYHRKRG